MGELFRFYSSWGHFLTLKSPDQLGDTWLRSKNERLVASLSKYDIYFRRTGVHWKDECNSLAETSFCKIPFHNKCEWRDSGNQTDHSPVDWIWSEAIMLREGGQMNSSELRGIRVAWLWARDQLISWLNTNDEQICVKRKIKLLFFFSVNQHHQTRRVYASVRRWYSIYSGEDHLYKLVSQVNVLGSKVSEEDVTLKHGDLVWVLLTEQNDHRACGASFIFFPFSPPPYPIIHLVLSHR